MQKVRKWLSTALVAASFGLAVMAMPAQAEAGSVTAALNITTERGMMADWVTITLTGPGGIFTKTFEGDSVSGWASFENVPAGTYSVEFTDYSMDTIYTQVNGGGYHNTSGTLVVPAVGNAHCGADYVYSDYGPPSG